jgi:hypothetical protein
MQRLRITTISLALLNVALALGVALLWKQGQTRVLEPATLVVPPLPLPDLAALNSIPMSSVDVATIRNQAVFYASRSFYQPAPAPVEVASPEYEMAGTLRLSDGKRIAFVRRKADRSSRTLHLGDNLDGWRVQIIDADRIVLGYNEQTAELRSNTVAGVSGLIRGPSAPPTAQTGIRVLGAAGSGAPRAAGQGSVEARTYHPPPQVGK